MTGPTGNQAAPAPSLRPISGGRGSPGDSADETHLPGWAGAGLAPMARLASELDRRMAGSYRLEQRGNANTAPAQSNGHLQRRSVAKGSGGTSSPAAGRAGQRREHAAATWRGGASGGGDAAVTSKEGRPGALEASGAVREAACTRGTGSPLRARPEGCDVGASTGVQCVRLCYQTHLRYSERCARCQVRRGAVRTVRAASEGGSVGTLGRQ